MSTISTEFSTNPHKITSKFTEEFEKYLKKQSLKTTFNGSDIETFSWYKKALGIAHQEDVSLAEINRMIENFKIPAKMLPYNVVKAQ